MTITTTDRNVPDIVEAPAGAGAGERVRPRTATRRLQRTLATVAVLIVLSGALYGFLGGGVVRSGESANIVTVARRSFPVILPEKGELKAANSVDVKCQIEGSSTIIWIVEEGTHVKQGDLLVRLASKDIDEKVLGEQIKEAEALAESEARTKEHEILLDRNSSDIRKAELKVELGRIALNKYEEGDWPQMLKDHNVAIERAQMDLDRKKEYFQNSAELLEKKYISQIDYNKDEFEYHQARWGLEKAKNAKEIVEKYTRVQDRRRFESDLEEAIKELDRTKKGAAAQEAKSAAALEAARAQLELTQQRLARFRKQKENTQIYAPADGMVVYDSGSSHWDRREIREGAQVHENQTIIKLPDTSVMVVVLRIHEAKTDKIKLGQRARVEVEGFPGIEFQGEVTKIAVLADSQNRWLNPDLKEYKTEITLDRANPGLKPGTTARAELIVEEVDNVLAVPVQAVYSRGGRHYVFRTGSEPQPAEVELGPASSEFVEVVSGLTEGDRVLLSVSEEVRTKLPSRPVGRNGAPATSKHRKRAARPKTATTNSASASGKVAAKS